MNDAERRVHDLAARQHNIITTAQAVGLGVPRRTVARRLGEGRWSSVYRGAHLIGLGPVRWLHRAQASVLLGGEGAGLSRRAAGALFELDSCQPGPVELTVPHPRHVAISGVISHRSRLLPDVEVRTWSGVAVTRIERTITELGVHLPPLALEKAMESAFRRGLTSAEALDRYLTDLGHRLPGARRLEAVLRERGESARVAGSPAEVELIACLRQRGIESPIRQYEIDLGGGWIVNVDLCWPWRRAVVEYYDVDVHAGAAAMAYDLERENAINDVGYAIRRYGGGLVRRNPGAVADQIANLLRRHPVVPPVRYVDGL
jgi:very-short-patch-repair endonuclease